MMPDNLAFYSDLEVENMFDEWGAYFDLLDRMGIEDEYSHEALVLLPHVPFGYEEVRREVLRRYNLRDLEAELKGE